MSQEQEQPKLTFEQYKKKLKSEAEIMRLRAEIASYTLQELASLNQYNQLRAQLMAAAEEGRAQAEQESPEAIIATEAAEIAAFQPDMAVETP